MVINAIEKTNKQTNQSHRKECRAGAALSRLVREPFTKMSISIKTLQEKGEEK